jgi:hypothetical protein
MFDDKQPATRSEWADQQLRRAILRGDFDAEVLTYLVPELRE